MRPLIAAALCCALQGCLFFYYKPAEPPEPGNTCITAGFFAGDRIRNEETGKIGVIERVYGPGSRCPASHPNRADVKY